MNNPTKTIVNTALKALRVFLLCNNIDGDECKRITSPFFSLEKGRNNNEFVLERPQNLLTNISINGTTTWDRISRARLGDMIECNGTIFILHPESPGRSLPKVPNALVKRSLSFVEKFVSVVKDVIPPGKGPDYLEAFIEALDVGGVEKAALKVSSGDGRDRNKYRMIKLSDDDQRYFLNFLMNPISSGSKETFKTSIPSHYECSCVDEEEEEEEEEGEKDVYINGIGKATRNYAGVIQEGLNPNPSLFNSNVSINPNRNMELSHINLNMDSNGNFPTQRNPETGGKNNTYDQESFVINNNGPRDGSNGGSPGWYDHSMYSSESSDLDQSFSSGASGIKSQDNGYSNKVSVLSLKVQNKRISKSSNNNQYDQEKVMREYSNAPIKTTNDNDYTYCQSVSAGDPQFIEPKNVTQQTSRGPKFSSTALSQSGDYGGSNSMTSPLSDGSGSPEQENSFTSCGDLSLKFPWEAPSPPSNPSGIKTFYMQNPSNSYDSFQRCSSLGTSGQNLDIKQKLFEADDTENSEIEEYLKTFKIKQALKGLKSNRNSLLIKKQTNLSKKRPQTAPTTASSSSSSITSSTSSSSSSYLAPQFSLPYTASVTVPQSFPQQYHSSSSGSTSQMTFSGQTMTPLQPHQRNETQPLLCSSSSSLVIDSSSNPSSSLTSSLSTDMLIQPPPPPPPPPPMMGSSSMIMHPQHLPYPVINSAPLQQQNQPSGVIQQSYTPYTSYPSLMTPSSSSQQQQQNLLGPIQQPYPFYTSYPPSITVPSSSQQQQQQQFFPQASPYYLMPESFFLQQQNRTSGPIQQPYSLNTSHPPSIMVPSSSQQQQQQQQQWNMPPPSSSSISPPPPPPGYSK